MSTVTGYNFSYPTYQNQSLIDSKLQGLQLNPASAPSIQLIYFCNGWFDVNKFPDEVKWQLFFAAHAYKSPDGTINLGHNAGGTFFIENLNYTHLAILYRPLIAYHREEKRQKGEGQAIFHKHLEIMEERFMEMCRWNKTMGQDLIQSLESQYDPNNLSSVINKIQAYLKELYPPEAPEGVINKKLSEARFNNVTYSSNGIIYQMDYFNNKNYEPFNPQPFKPKIPDEVKWQILFASTAFINANGEVFLGYNFSVEHLRIEHLTLLLKIFTIYHKYEKTRLQGRYAIFDKHIKVVTKQILKGGDNALEQVRQVLDAPLEQKRSALEQKRTTLEKSKEFAKQIYDGSMISATSRRDADIAYAQQIYYSTMKNAGKRHSFENDHAKASCEYNERYSQAQDLFNKTLSHHTIIANDNAMKDRADNDAMKADYDDLERQTKIRNVVLKQLNEENND